MTTRKIFTPLILLILFALLVAACTSPTIEDPAATLPAATTEATPSLESTPAGDPQADLAPVERVTVTIPSTAGEPFIAHISGNLPNGCTELAESNVERQGEEVFHITLNMNIATGQACTEALVPYETEVPLGVAGGDLAVGDYVVTVNDATSYNFTIDSDGTASEGLPTVTPLPEGAETATPDAGTSPLAVITFEPGESIATGQEEEVIEASTGDLPGDTLPQHQQITFSGYPLTGTQFMPRVYVFPVAAYSETNEFAAAQDIPALQGLLEDRPDVITETTLLPLLPHFNTPQIFFSNIEYVDFANGSGVRYITQLAHDVSPVANEGLFYTFQGLTDDGRYYVSAVLPINHPDLPATQADADFDFNTTAEEYEAYLDELVGQLEAAPAGRFTPSLEALDALIESLVVEPAASG